MCLWLLLAVPHSRVRVQACNTPWLHWHQPVACSRGTEEAASSDLGFHVRKMFPCETFSGNSCQEGTSKKQYSRNSGFCCTSLMSTGDIDFSSINVSGSILFKCMSLEADRMTEHQEKVLSILEERFPDLPSREEIISALQETQFNTQGSATSFHFSHL